MLNLHDRWWQGGRRSLGDRGVRLSGQTLTGLVTEQRAVGVQRGLAAEVCIQHSGIRSDVAAADEVDQGRHRLALVHRVDDHAFKASDEPDGIQGRVDRDAVIRSGPTLENGDLVVA